MKKEILTVCPECGSPLSPMEIKWCQCDTCGWPYTIEEDLGPYDCEPPPHLRALNNKTEPNGDTYTEYD